MGAHPAFGLECTVKRCVQPQAAASAFLKRRFTAITCKGQKPEVVRHEMSPADEALFTRTWARVAEIAKDHLSSKLLRRIE